MQGFPDFTKIALPAADQITARLGEMPDAINPGAIDNAEQLPLPALASGDAETQARLAGSQPGIAPFLRGPYPSMYATRPWTIRQYAGSHGHHGSPHVRNRRPSARGAEPV